jgi:hypothetical protein
VLALATRTIRATNAVRPVATRGSRVTRERVGERLSEIRSVWRVYETCGMAREFAGVQRGQLLLMPPSLSEWLPEDHLVWTVLGAVDQMDLDRFRRRIGWAAPAARPLTRRCWSRFCSTPTRAGSGPRGRSSGRAGKMSRSS